MSVVFFADSDNNGPSFRRNLPGTIAFIIIYLVELICFCSGSIVLILQAKKWITMGGYFVDIDLVTKVTALVVLSGISGMLAAHSLYRPLQTRGRSIMYSFGAFVSGLGGLTSYFVYFYGYDVYGLENVIHGFTSLFLSLGLIFKRESWIGSALNPFVEITGQNLKNSNHGIKQLNQIPIPVSSGKL